MAISTKSKSTAGSKPPVTNEHARNDSDLARDLRLLRAILESSNHSKPIPRVPRRPRAPITTAPLQSAKPVRSIEACKKAGKQGNGGGSVAQNGTSPAPPASATEQRRLAMNCFNRNLKILSVAAKTWQDRSTASSGSEGPAVRHDTDSEIDPSTHSWERKGAHTTENAECACAALAVLRLHDVAEPAFDESWHKREQGALLLLDKIVTLGHQKLAQTEASKIHEQYWKRWESSSRSQSPVISMTKETIALMSGFQEPEDKRQFEMLTSLQSQLLRLAVLHGSVIVKQEFVDAVKLTNKSSPPAVIILAHRKGLLATKIAGQNLRTISQALLMIHTVTANQKDHSESSHDHFGFELLAEALLIRVSSWHLLQHSPNLTKEFWTPLERGIKTLWGKQPRRDLAGYDLLVSTIRKLQNTLETSSMQSDIPEELFPMLAHIAEKNGDLDTAVMYLEKAQVNAKGTEALTLVCRITIMILRRNEPLSTDAVHKMEKLIQIFSKVIASDTLLNAEDLTLIAQLRKACLERLSSSTASELDTFRCKAEETCLQLMSSTLSFCIAILQCKTHGGKLQQTLFLVTLKGWEAILDLEKSMFCARSSAFEQYLKIVEHVMKPMADGNDLEIRLPHSEKHQTALTALKIRVSNLFWRAHINKFVTPGFTYNAIALAQISLRYLNDLSSEDAGRAALGPRLEKLAEIFARLGQFESARDHVKRAIRHYIDCGALADSVEASLSGPGRCVWTESSTLSCQLGRALHTYYDASYQNTDTTSPEECLYDDENLPAIHRAILLEQQVLYILKKRPVLATIQEVEGMIRRIIDLTQAPEHRVWASRFVSMFVFRTSKISGMSAVHIAILQSCIDSVLHTGTQASGPFLKSFSNILKFQLKLQEHLHSELVSQDDQNQHIQTLKQIVEILHNPGEIEAIVDDVEVFLSILQAYTDRAFALHCYEVASLCLRISIQTRQHGTEASVGVITDLYISLALCQIRLERVQSAKESLLKAETFQNPSNSAQRIRLCLARAEYHLSISALRDCKVSLIEAGSSLSETWPSGCTLSGAEQIERDHLIATAATLASELAFRHGDLLLAARYARQATKISTSIWSALEKRILTINTACTGMATTRVAVQEKCGAGNVSEKTCVPFNAMGPRYWPHLNLHIKSVSNLAQNLLHLGLSEDSLHYLEQLNLLTSFMPSVSICLQSTSTLALFYTKVGSTQEATEFIGKFMLLLDGITEPHLLVDAILRCSEALVIQGELILAQDLTSRIPNCATDNNIEVTETDQSIKEVKRNNKARRGAHFEHHINGLPLRTKAANQASTMRQKVEARQQESQASNAHQQSASSRRRAVLHACRSVTDCSDPNSNTDLDFDFAALLQSTQSTTKELFEAAKLLLSRGWRALSADAFASVLTESAVALPCQSTSSTRRPRASFVQGSATGIDGNPRKEIQALSCSESSSLAQINYTLQCAQKLCDKLLNERQMHCPTDMIHVLVKMEARILLLLTSMNLPYVTSSTDLVLKASQPKELALQRENIACFAEQATRDRASLSLWPGLEYDTSGPIPSIAANQLNDLPSSWSILSLTLAEDNDELLLSKTVQGRDPFLVRIPLRRSNEGDTPENFSFWQAKKEMQEIIQLADSSSHDVRGTADKSNRAQWHADREALDNKLQLLLENIELVWLGGFRGILAPCMLDEEDTKRFKGSLVNSLNKNLPSRQKASPADGYVQIHDHILEIFLGLGDPEENDLDDPIMDLLYFVVDVLQFNGERNAYDEIEWDSILVDVLDALLVYHKNGPPRPPRHTILIVDKELQMFPWEALPCLINHPVSRMPSLGSVFDRITQMRAQSSCGDPQAMSLASPTITGTYIVNPSGDLKGTQALFEPILSQNLPSPRCTSLINTPPTEAQFSSSLQHSDILLYIGHGSGAQYIRPRTIRSLDSCAITFLFGCSSAKMTEHGDFESTGMPKAYMLGHAPAFVGCLWDVTDREIDRVALKTLSIWGLIDGEDERVKEGLKRKGKKGKAISTDNGKVSARKEEKMQKKTLVEAVRDGREACVLRYLCGAAVVMYGVPIILE